MPQKPLIFATAIAEYIAHGSCPRRAKLTLAQNEIVRRLPFAGRVFAPLDVALKTSGAAREQAWEQFLRTAGLRALNERVPTMPDQKASRSRKTPRLQWAEFVARLADLSPGEAAFAREVEIRGGLGAFEVAGRIDFIALLWRDGLPYLRLAECKSARQDKMRHIVQVALYQMLVAQWLTANTLWAGGQRLEAAQIECLVARIDETTGENQPLLRLPPLELATEIADLTRLLAPDGALARIHAAELDALPFQIGPPCHECSFSYHCMVEGARQRRLELLGLEPSLADALRAAGLTTIDELADLETDDAEGVRLRADPQFTAHLPWLIQRARRRTLPDGERDSGGYAVQALVGAGSGQLPPHEIGGQRLTRVYLAVDFDHVASRRSNMLEAAVIVRLLAAARLGEGEVGCLTPHRAQRTHLTEVLASFRSIVSVIDTIERLQGGERRVIIVSATASDPVTISARAEFLLDVNRALVALSRAQERLIVVVAASLLDHVPADREDYLAARLWKALRELCPACAGETTEENYKVRLYLPPEG